MYKIFSYLLLCVGLFIILFALHGMYRVFIGGGAILSLVNFADLTVQTQFGPMVFPMQQASVIANLVLFTLFMGFLVATGGKLAQISCQILKNERIYDALLKLKPQDVTVHTFKNI
ncbi:MAG: hypothetical protein J6Q05_02040 [Elusimicrobiaceae bacterium]|nr:hypothetical protein [Elusimicrobiaceae bacterium]